ncbi:MAG TPA: insulinase family protein [Smithellaceae bacterium]|nr:insulinase family protein [Smithellaceae bacterium]HRS89288.1 insulinase family protein [Smithellaceae bacterium]HRV25158.1 insulinase family protein [Smithellaceae bacterium]
MPEKTPYPKPSLRAGDSLRGFKVLRVKPIAALRLTAYELKHIKTGAKILHLHSFERENLYAICFRTPPEDSTGLPHILEHCVLAGSEKYPLKDVFKELLRSSMQTFLNAFTYPDKTVYPVASQIKADFYNLARVYTDLVLHPRLLKENFLQEGHHFELAVPGDLSSDLIISGIVYNEMKGAYSSVDALMYKALQENLYPKSVYAFDSGGDPDVIPALTYQQFKDFHRRYYSPANARFFFYGDISTAEHLAFLSEMLADFDKIKVNSAIENQPFFSRPRLARSVYPVDREEPTEKKTMVNVAWMLAENTDYETALLLQIVSGLLISSAASPLRKALIDSGMGEDLTPVSGMESDLKQIMFCVGLRNAEKSDAEKIEELILDTLRQIVTSGYDKELIEGILHQVEFHGREIVRGSYPYGIALMGSVFQTWLYDGDPLAGLDFPREITRIRKLWSRDPKIFQKITRKWLLDNPHRVLSIMEPDPGFTHRHEDKLKKKMAALKKRFSEEELRRIDAQAEQLRKFQSEPDAPAAINTLPKLQLKEIPRRVETIPVKALRVAGTDALQHDIFTNGISYVDLAFDLACVPEELHPYLPLLGKVMTGMGAAGFGYGDMAKRIALHMGNFGYDLAAGFSADGNKIWQKMIFSFSALYRNIGKAVDILRDVLLAGDLEDRERMRDLIAERKNSLQSAIVPSGHIFAKRAAGAALTLPAWRDEQWHGRTQFRFMQKIAAAFPETNKDICEKLTKLKELIFTRDNLLVNFTADGEGLRKTQHIISPLLEKIPRKSVPANQRSAPLTPVRAGIAVPSQVSYIARVLKAPPYTDPATPMLTIASRELSNTYLYKHIRVQGGAYGGMSTFDATTGIFAFLSYRDPHIVRTLNTFEEAQKFYARHLLTDDDMEKAIISTLSAMDKPMDPAGKGYISMMRHFASLDDKMRQKFRQDILSATPAKMRQALENYFSAKIKEEAVAVYAAREKLDEANKDLNNKLMIESLM